MPKFLRVLAVVFTLTLLALIPRSCTPASAVSSLQSAGLESRISGLESEIFQLRSQIYQLQTQVSRQAGTGIRSSPTIPPSSPVTPNAARLAPSAIGDDPMFKRLATLVIELKERVTALEKKVNPSPRR
ncbi:MAG TPA: hypothetical protein V6C85_04640 [Allocoleopsis sp.]